MPYDAYLQVAVLGFGVSVTDFWAMSPCEFKVLWQGYAEKNGMVPPIAAADMAALKARFGKTGVSIKKSGNAV